ncbi:MAG TPA: hypothetical protein VGK86_07025 [Thermoanaerobaculia bacterium]
MRSRLIFAAVFGLVSSTAFGAGVTFSAAGSDAASIQVTVDAFRTALGTLNPNTAGSFPSGRREINWDGVPDALAAPNNLPANFFNVNSPRGVVFSTAGTGFQVSATAASGVPVEFGNINATYPSIFQTFSPQRLFTALSSNVVDINFFVPGSTTPATTSGFGAVFTDVDNANTTAIGFFDALGNGLGTFFVPAANNGLSFLGVLFNAGERVGRVRITSGNVALGPATNDAPTAADVVVMDDFIYAEPQGVVTPTPTATETSTSTPTPTATSTPTLLATSTPTATATVTSTPTLAPTSTPTVVGGGGPAPGTIPTLSPGMLVSLAIGLAAVAVLLIRRA